MKSDSRITKNALWCLSFILPVGIYLINLACNNIAPFGSQSILQGDLMYQYIDFFHWYKGLFSGENSIFYSSSQALGNNTWGLFSYYLSSPFNLLVVFFSEENLSQFVVLITGLKLGFIGVATCFYLRKRFDLSAIFSLSLSICFVWSSWVISQTRNIIWLDALILLPLIAYFIYRYIINGKWGFLLATITISIIVCWYTAYMLIVFSCLFLCFELYLRNREFPLPRKLILRRILFYLVLLVLAVLVAAISFIPTIFAMIGDGNGSSSGFILPKRLFAFIFGGALLIIAGLLIPEKKFPFWVKVGILIAITLAVIIFSYRVSHDFSCSFTTLLSTLFYGYVSDGSSPQLYTGTFVLLGLGLFFAFPTIPKQIKLAGAVFLLVMLVSTWYFYAYYAWCGFKAPNGFYCRIAFLFSFLCIFLAAFAYKQVQENSLGLMRLCIPAASLALLAFVLCCLDSFENWSSLVITLVLLLIYTSLIGVYLKRVDKNHVAKAFLSIGLIACISVEHIAATGIEWSIIYTEYGDEYHKLYRSESSKQLDELRNSDRGYYRLQKTYSRIEPAALNEGLSQNYQELNSYSSAYNASAINLLNALGYSNEGEFSTAYSEPILLSDSLLGVKYVSTDEKPAGFEDIGLSQSYDGNRFYLNPYALSLGYEVNQRAVNLSLPSGANPFERQNEFISSLLGYQSDCYRKADAQLVSDEIDSKLWKITLPANTIGYTYIEAPKDLLCTLTIDNATPFEENWRFMHSVHSLGQISASSQSHEVLLIPTASADFSKVEAAGFTFSDDADCIFYYLDMDAFESALATLSESQFVPTVFEDGYIEGVYHATEDSYLLLSIPRENGWTITINGESVTSESAADNALMLLPVSKGDNNIEMRFVSPGFALGAAVSAITLLTLLVSRFLMKRRNEKHNELAS